MQQLPTVLPPPALTDGSEAPPRSAERHANLVRFQSELEFVQCLASPQYLHELSTQGYFGKPAFLNYLKYLEYWRAPEYVRYIVYPTCLVYLTLLQTDLFRARLGDPGFIAELIRVGTKHHETWRVQKPVTAGDSSKPLISDNTTGVSGGGDGDGDDDDEDMQDATDGNEGRQGPRGTGGVGGKKKKRTSRGDSGVSFKLQAEAEAGADARPGREAGDVASNGGHAGTSPPAAMGSSET